MISKRRKTAVITLFITAAILSLAVIIALPFIAPAPSGQTTPHSHGYSVETVAPTCTDGGYSLYKCACGDSYRAEEADALGHDYVAEWTVDMQPSCTSLGSKSRHCSRCDEKTEITVIPANGHSFGGWETVKESACETAGVSVQKCGVCGTEEYAYPQALGHSVTFSSTPYRHKGECARCGKDFGARHLIDGSFCADCGYKAYPTNGLEYALADDGASYVVKGRGGAIEEDIVIPSHFNGLPVTELGLEAFSGDDNLRSVILGNEITRLSSYAFYGCHNLKKVWFPPSVNRFCDYVFDFCYNLEELSVDEDNSDFYSSGNCVIDRAKKSVKYGGITATVPADGSVAEIYERAFFGRKGLKNITIPEAVTAIGQRAFYSCEGLTEIDLHNSVTYLGIGAFEKCTGLKEVVIPSSLKTIPLYLFDNCANLKKIVISDGVQSVSSYAFKNTSVTKLFIPKSVQSIDGSSLCGLAVGLSVDDENPVYELVNDCIIEKSTKTLAVGCITSVIPDDGSVTAIGEDAFYGCPITQLVIPETVTWIGAGAFYGTAISEIALPSKLETIENHLFYNCKNLSKVSIPEGVTEIGRYAFANCTSLKEVVLPAGLKILNNSAFYKSGIKHLIVPSQVTKAGALHYDELEWIIFEEGVEEISFFDMHKKLETVSLPSTLRSFQISAFRNCECLRTIYYSGSVNEWNGISNAENILKHLPQACVIVCNDGVIKSDGTVQPNN